MANAVWAGVPEPVTSLTQNIKPYELPLPCFIVIQLLMHQAAFCMEAVLLQELASHLLKLICLILLYKTVFVWTWTSFCVNILIKSGQKQLPDESNVMVFLCAHSRSAVWPNFVQFLVHKKPDLMQVFVGFDQQWDKENWHIFIEHRVQQKLASCLVSMSLLTHNYTDEMAPLAQKPEDGCRTKVH